MTRTMADLAAQNAGMEAMLKQVLDRMTSMDTKVDELQEKFANSTKRMDLFEKRWESRVPPFLPTERAMAPDETDLHRQTGANGIGRAHV